MTQNLIKISIFHTNDMHGNLDAMARLASIYRRERSAAEADGRIVFFFDAGDAADRKLTIVSSSKGAAFGPVLTAMGYDLQALGNDLVLTYGPQCVPDYAAGLGFPLLALNLRNGNTPLFPEVAACAILDLPGDQCMGVAGLTPQAVDAYTDFGIEMPDPVPLLLETVRELKSDSAGIVVLLSHSGLQVDRVFAEICEGIDVIIGGHSHDALPVGEVLDGVLLAHAGEYAEYLGRVDIEYDPAAGRVVSSSAHLIPVSDDDPPDPAVIEAIDRAEQTAAAINARPAAHLETPLELDYFRECSLGDFTADALRVRMGAEAAIISPGLFHTGLPAGTITLGQLRKACFSTANPAVSELTGAQILRALETGVEPKNEHQALVFLRGAPVGLPQVSGMQVWLDPHAESGQRVKRVEIQGKPLDREAVYRVAHTDVEVFHDLYIHQEPGQHPRFEMPTILNEVILDAFHSGSLTAPPAGRWIDVNQNP